MTILEAGGRTIAVLGTPLGVAYPRENAALQRRIAPEHLLVSQFPKGHPSGRTNFPRRNRTMALLTDATVIVEAGESSGTLSQGWEALRLGRELFVLKSLAKNTELGERLGGPMIEWVVRRLRHQGVPPLERVLGPDAVLVPLPKSAPLPPKQRNFLRAPLGIAQALVAEGWGQSVAPILIRVRAVQKSAFAAPGQRPDPQSHLESMLVEVDAGRATDRRPGEDRPGR